MSVMSNAYDLGSAAPTLSSSSNCAITASYFGAPVAAPWVVVMVMASPGLLLLFNLVLASQVQPGEDATNAGNTTQGGDGIKV